MRNRGEQWQFWVLGLSGEGPLAPSKAAETPGLKTGLEPLQGEAVGFMLRRDLALKRKSRRICRCEGR